jgi:capsular polysaccharide export protein
MRTFLFLQGVASPFFAKLSGKLSGLGYKTYRVNFCGGDVFFSAGQKSWNYQDRPEQFPGWLEEKITKYSITDIILFGDTRPMHVHARHIAKKLGINTFVYEEGYLRPFWLTLEKEGVNAHSSLPKDPDWYLKNGKDLFKHTHGEETGYKLSTRVWHDIRFHIANLLYQFKFPHYRTHRPHKAHVEYAGWIWRFSRLPLYKWQAYKTIRKLVKEKKSYYLLPLQLNSDSQIRIHSEYASVEDVLKKVITSFVQHTKPDELLVIKNHPLDTGLINYGKIIRRLARENNLDKNRIIYLQVGNIPILLDYAQGTVLVNSTVGMSSLFHKTPTCVLGTAIYDMEGLTFQGSLDHFWEQKTKPDQNLYTLFMKSVIHLTQVNGDFYTKTGINMAVDGSIRHLDIGYAGATSKNADARTDNNILATPYLVPAQKRVSPALNPIPQDTHTSLRKGS